MRGWLYDVLKLNPDFQADIITQFDAALQACKEQDIHAFFEGNIEAFEFVCPRGLVVSKMPLGSSFVTDFTLIVEDLDSNDPTPVATLVEIERADIRLFTKTGDPTAQLTHAIRQVQNWKRWVTTNRSFFIDEIQRYLEEEPIDEIHSSTRDRLIRELAACGMHDRYLVIAGRREDMSREDRLLLGQMNLDLQGIGVISYDVVRHAIITNAGQRSYRSRWRALL